ncbi:Sel1 repeat family protein [Paraburkholderia sacchari]|uniref:hypothetical protein n=1 Tax=Paraburkholderia sacchari TaxID=159450 RepID=UPI0039A5CDD4
MESHRRGQYFEENREISEQQAASRWFTYTQDNGIEISRAISLWEDAATPEGERSRETIASSGIRIVPPEY